MASLDCQEQALDITKVVEMQPLADPVQNHCSAPLTNNVSHDEDESEDVGGCNVSPTDANSMITDGLKSMHISVASSIDDDRSSVEILSPPYVNHFKHSDESSALEAAFPPDKIHAMLKTQLEYYFSPENLSQDKYLLTQMDRDQWVPISIIAGFNQVKRLTNRVELVTEVLKESAVVEVDEVGQKVRPASKRRTIILREIPEGTKKEDVEALFHGDGCPKFVDCVFAHNEHWYVTFINEDEAQRALLYLREKGRTFNGEPIKARLKAGLPLAVSTSSFVRPGQNGIVSVQSYDVSTASAPAPAVAIPPAAKCAYTPLPTVQYIQHPSYPFFPPPSVWPANVYIGDAATIATAFYPAAISAAHIPPSFHPAPAAYYGPRQRTRQSSGSSYRGGSSMQSGRHQSSATVDGAGNAASSSNQPPRFSRRHNEQNLLDASEGAAAASSTSNVSNGPSTVSHASHSTSSSVRTVASVNASFRGAYERSGGTRAVASAQGNHVNSSSAESSHAGGDLPAGQQPYSNYGRSAGARRGTYRGRRKGNDDSHSRIEQRKARESENFELEPTSFPPLPGNPTNNVFGDVVVGDSKTLSDVVKGVGKSTGAPASSGIASAAEKSQSLVPATAAQSASRPHKQPSQAAVTLPCTSVSDGDAVTPVSSTVSVTHGRINRSTSTDSLGVMAAESTVTSTVDNRTSVGAVNNSTAVIEQNSFEDSKPRTKLSYAQILAQRGKEANETTINSNSCADQNSSESVNNSELSKESAHTSQASSGSDSNWKNRSGTSAPLEQRQPTNASTSHFKNSRFQGGRGNSFAGGDGRHRQRTYNGVATVGSAKH